MSYIRAKEVEQEVEEEMATKFVGDSLVKRAENEILRKKMEVVDPSASATLPTEPLLRPPFHLSECL
jgi:hypothetical protein